MVPIRICLFASHAPAWRPAYREPTEFSEKFRGTVKPYVEIYLPRAPQEPLTTSGALSRKTLKAEILSSYEEQTSGDLHF